MTPIHDDAGVLLGFTEVTRDLTESPSSADSQDLEAMRKAGPRAADDVSRDESDRPARVLIVDDERINRELLEVMLEPEGFVLMMAASGEEALGIVARQAPDLVLLDIMMPGMDGYEVAATLKANPASKNIRIIMVTAQRERDSMMRGLNAGADDLLTKPVDRAELCVRVKNLLRLKMHGDDQDRHSQVLEREVVESERLYRSTFDAAPVGIVHAGLDGQWLRVNQRLCSLLGYSCEALQQVGIEKLLRSDEREVPGEAEAFRKMREGTLDRHVIDEKRYRRRDGSFLWARVSTSVHRDAKGRPVHLISVVEDITERRGLEAQLRQSQKMEAVGRLAGGVAHDFNNLLSVILSYAKLATESLIPDDPLREDLEEISKAGQRAADLTAQLLAFSRQQVIQPKVIELNESIAQMEKMLRRVLGEDIELRTIAAIPSWKVKTDPSQVEHVLMNLAVNARDAMPNGGTLTIETGNVELDEAYAREHLGTKPGPHVMLAVSDTGVGMDAATKARIFEPFYTTKGVGKGTGLGLSTVFGVVQQSGGSIWVYSEPGRGTTFKLYFPRSEDSAPPLVARSSAAPARRGPETILLVEDEEQLRRLAEVVLRRHGYNVVAAANPAEALGLSEQHTGEIDLLLTDVVMPGMNGRQLAERLAKSRPEMRVLFMSGYTGDVVVHHGVLDEGVAFLQKPFTPDVLVRALRDVLDVLPA